MTELEKCTFKPKIKHSFQSQKGMTTVGSGKATPKLSINSVLPERVDRSPLDIEFEKQKQECSFNPQINPKSKEIALLKTDRGESGARKKERKFSDLELSRVSPTVKSRKSPGREIPPKILPSSQILSSKNEKSRNCH
mmetsp:Transcript_7901/g.7410  ORF Transcript_7901/g.7410 Transcript_7901/m.7410 type:complete len:138 (+) Transcript_7901:1588-2001(+)